MVVFLVCFLEIVGPWRNPFFRSFLLGAKQNPCRTLHLPPLKPATLTCTEKIAPLPALVGSSDTLESVFTSTFEP